MRDFGNYMRERRNTSERNKSSESRGEASAKKQIAGTVSNTDEEKLKAMTD